jgi:serine/threonine-protein kinase
VTAKIGAYTVEKKLAEGGFGSVYVARSPKGTRVALKLPRLEDKQAKVALADEARMGSRLRHPAIIETLDFFEDKGRAVLVVEFIEGANLMELRAHAGALPSHAVVELGRQIASALDFIHGATDEAGKALEMIHRDVSPANILVDAEGQARLIDMGIARSVDRKQDATKKGLVKGTFRYLAPEILEGGSHTRSTDLWALGVTLWEASLGRFAVPGKTTQTMRAILDGSLTKLQPGERIEPELKSALLSLVAPLERRVKNARVAKTVLTRIAHEQPGGREVLAHLVQTKLQNIAPNPAIAASTEVLERSRSSFAAKSASANDEDAVETEVSPLADHTVVAEE